MATNTAKHARPTRRSRAGFPEARSTLNTEVIVTTACQLIAESHVDQLTMRRLSERLGVALGATYHHVPTRDALLNLVAERINDQVKLPSTNPRDWTSILRVLMHDYAAAYDTYPGMATYMRHNMASTSPTSTRVQLMPLLEAAGFEHESAIDVLTAFFFYGSTAADTDLLNRDQPGYPAEEIRRRFENGLELLLKGAAVQLREDKRARKLRRT
jgi:AcrR family transcriptional regulator